MRVELPPLPEASSPTSYICVECSYVGSVGPTHIKRGGEACDYLALTIPAMFDADQMRKYGRACERAAYERAAALCGSPYSDETDDPYECGFNRAAEVIADAIRALGDSNDT